MDEVKCLICGELIKMPPNATPSDYDGQLFCHKCNLLWDIKLKSSEIIKYKLAKQQPKVKPKPTGSFKFVLPDGTELTPEVLARAEEIEGKSLIKESKEGQSQ
jgi:hypothetical protein